MRQRLTLITLGVKDVGRARAFYEGLGWKPSEQSMEDYVLFPSVGSCWGCIPYRNWR